jgi:RND family efflux transporter MFP subunit
MSQTQSSGSRDALATLRIDRSNKRRRPSLVWRLTRFVLGLLLLVSLVAAGLALAHSKGWLSLAQWITPHLEVRVAIVEVVRGRSADALVVATGYLQSRRQARIGAKSPGRIEALHVDEGTRVTVGQELAVLEHAELEAALAASLATWNQTKAELAEHEVQIKLYRRDHERLEKLLKSRTVSEDEYDDAKYAYDMAIVRRGMLEAVVALAEARAQQARQLIEDMYIRAPFDGTVISKDAEVGESILPGGMGEGSGRGSVVTIADLDHLEVDTDVKEDYIGRIRIGQTCEVTVDAVPDQRYQGRVRKIIPMGDRARATIKVRVEILDADERLFPEMSSTVYFLPEAGQEQSMDREAGQPRVFCPPDAIVPAGDDTFVWLVDQAGLVKRVAVVCGAIRDNRVEIENGLAGGERVVLDPPSDLQAGQQVRVSE